MQPRSPPQFLCKLMPTDCYCISYHVRLAQGLPLGSPHSFPAICPHGTGKLTVTKEHRVEDTGFSADLMNGIPSLAFPLLSIVCICDSLYLISHNSAYNKWQESFYLHVCSCRRPFTKKRRRPPHITATPPKL